MESRFLVVSGLLLLVLIAVALLGERTLPLFDGDRSQAARFYKFGAIILAGGAFAFAMPKLAGSPLIIFSLSSRRSENVE